MEFAKNSFSKRCACMLRVDARRMLRSRLFYIMIAAALLVPVVMTVMLVMMDGQESVDQQTGEVTIMEGPDSVWQSIGTLPSSEGASADAAAMGGGMDVMAMCNINMAFMGVAVFVCLFICDDFRSGYAKNLFTVRAARGEYVLSKTVMGALCGALMLVAYFIGAMLAGGITGLSFAMVGGMSAFSVVMCLLSKILLMLVFVPIFVTISVAAKSRAWLAICGSLGGGMLLFMMVGLITPLTATFINVALCAAGGAMFAFGLGAISRVILRKTALV
ncbi:MAG: ABC transporter permease [Clostridia bacterium]|nr:ABC transporter permease [Clostridia bacterium]MBQ9785687.1 ABC transporter permease [Clostridia bacterium]